MLDNRTSLTEDEVCSLRRPVHTQSHRDMIEAYIKDVLTASVQKLSQECLVDTNKSISDTKSDVYVTASDGHLPQDGPLRLGISASDSGQLRRRHLGIRVSSGGMSSSSAPIPGLKDDQQSSSSESLSTGVLSDSSEEEVQVEEFSIPEARAAGEEARDTEKSSSILTLDTTSEGELVCTPRSLSSSRDRVRNTSKNANTRNRLQESRGKVRANNRGRFQESRGKVGSNTCIRCKPTPVSGFVRQRKGKS